MKRAKLMLVAIGIFAIVGGTLAVSASKRGSVAFCTTLSNGNPVAIPNYTTTTGTPTIYCTIPSQPGLVYTRLTTAL